MSIYFYYDAADCKDLCELIRSLDLDVYTYKGEEVSFEEFQSNILNSRWYVLVPKGIQPVVGKYRQIDGFSESIVFHTMYKSQIGMEPAFITSNKGKRAEFAFKKIRKFITSHYPKGDSGIYTSPACFNSWLEYKTVLIVFPKFEVITSNPETFSFEKFVKCFSQKGYLIHDKYDGKTGDEMSLTKDSYIITLPGTKTEDVFSYNTKHISVYKKKRKGGIFYLFTMDYRYVYHNEKEMLTLYKDIESFCSTI